MKRININKIFKLGLLSFSVVAMGTSCVKSVSGRTDFENLQPTVLIPEGGMANFASDAILFPPTDDNDTTYFHLNYAGTSTAPTDQVITIAIDDQAIADYNALGGNQYEKFPDSIYSFTTTSVTVPKGANYSAPVGLIMHPSKIDLLKNYMLPITITAAPAGSSISVNYKTIYYHLIGNPIAGIYTQEWIRYNNAAGTGTPAYDLDVSPGVFAPVDGNTINTTSGSAGLVYVLTFDNNAGVLSNFAVSFDAASVAASGVKITGGPTIIKADPTTGSYTFNFTYDNEAGGLRNITDIFGK